MRLLILLAIALSASSAHAKSLNLCAAQEQVLFHCMAKNKAIAICASHEFSADSGYVQYRYGTPKKIELKYPAALVPPKGYFWFSSTPYSGGGEARLRFINSGVKYEVFDRTIRTGFGADGLHYPETTSGVMRSSPSHSYKDILCTTDGALNSELYKEIEKEAFNSTP